MFVWILPNGFAAARHIGETKGRFVSVRLFLHLRTMEKLQLYSHQKLCYNSLVSELRGALSRKYLLAATLLQGEVS